MNHFLEISQLSSTQIESLLTQALSFKNTKHYPNGSAHQVALLFYENSTRTRVSFELAAKHLSMTVINLDLNSSSERKGEVIEDTLQTLVAMGIGYFVIRHQDNGLPQRLATKIGQQAQIINAGDGTHAHPSQALLDLMTIVEQKPRLEQLKIAVLGDIKHSRVANSFQCLCQTMGVGELVLIAPKLWQPELLHYGRVTDDAREGLSGADVVMCLRVQQERLAVSEGLDLATYRRDFALTQERMAYLKSDAMVLHPGPMNRGIEIDSEIADGPQSFILQQVTNGIFMRMAILQALFR